MEKRKTKKQQEIRQQKRRVSATAVALYFTWFFCAPLISPIVRGGTGVLVVLVYAIYQHRKRDWRSK